MASESSSSRYYFLVEAGLIVFSVLLGFGIQEWRSAAQMDEQRIAALDNIKTEIWVNRGRVKRALEYNQYVLDTLSHVRQQPQEVRLAFMRNFSENLPNGLVSAVFPQTTAWTAAQTTQVMQRMDYKTVSILGRPYEMQKLYLSQRMNISNLVFEQIIVKRSGEEGLDGLVDDLPKVLPLLQNIVAQERTLVGNYEMVFELMEWAPPFDDPADARADDGPSPDAS